MSERRLATHQVAALLVSASYGIGFLFGSGELAIGHGMAGGVYGVATAVGMLVLAAFARQLWATGIPVWEMFGQAYGATVQRVVALLSLTWMAGVLAAQMQGCAAVLHLLGLSGWQGELVVWTLIFGASRLDLRFASAVFSGCLLASALVLAYALVVGHGVDIYVNAIPTFVQDLSTFRPSHILAILLAVGLLVCTGSDYHQFVLAARRPSTAVAGCALAGVILILIAFLPPAVVVAMHQAGRFTEGVEAKHVVPLLLSQVAATVGPGADKLMLVALTAAALGSGAAILRAMTSALASGIPGARSQTHPGFALGALALGAAVAARDQAIIETMVSVNVIYIASVAVCFATLLRGVSLAPRIAVTAIVVGFSVSLAVYVAGWAGWLVEDVDLFSLGAGLGASIGVTLLSSLRDRRRLA